MYKFDNVAASTPDDVSGAAVAARRAGPARSLLGTAIAVALLMSPSAFAQEAETADEPAQPDAVTLDSVMVTAQRRAQRVQDVPFTLSALSADNLKEAGVLSIFDLPAAVSGLSFGGAGNLVQPSIRGVSATVSVGGAENSNSLYVDGVFYSQAHLFGSNLPDIERIEVLKGPQGTLFGRNSVGGAVRIFTRAPSFVPTGDFSVDFGYFTGGEGSRSAPHHVLKAFYSAPLVDDKLAFSISAAHDYTPGWMTDDLSGERTAPLERINTRGKLLFTPNENLSVLVNAFYLRHDDRGVQGMTPIDGLVASSQYPGSVVPTRPYHTGFDVTPGIGHWDDADVESRGISAQVEWTIGAGTLTSTTSTSKDEIYNQTTIHQSYGSLQCLQFFACLHLDRGSSNEAVSQEFNFTSEQLGRFSYSTGLFYYDSDATGFNYVNGDVNPASPQGTLSYIQQLNLTSTAIYGELQMEATDRLTAIVGGRYTREKRHDYQTAPVALDRAEDFSSFLPRLSFLYELTPTTNVYATYSVGEASGLTGISNTGSVPRFLPVQPEKNTAYEIGLKYATRQATFNVAGFFYDYEDKQEQVGVLGAGETYAVFHVNTGPVRIFGMDADASYRLSDDLTLRGNMTWVPEAEYQDFANAVGISTDRRPNGQFEQVFFDATGWRLMRAPEFTGSMSLAYTRDLARGGRLDASGTVLHQSKVFHDTYHVIEGPAYTTLSARLGYTFPGSGLRIGLYGNNLTNEVYLHHGFASAAGFTANYARPREVGMSLSYGF